MASPALPQRASGRSYVVVEGDRAIRYRIASAAPAVVRVAVGSSSIQCFLPLPRLIRHFQVSSQVYVNRACREAALSVWYRCPVIGNETSSTLLLSSPSSPAIPLCRNHRSRSWRACTPPANFPEFWRDCRGNWASTCGRLWGESSGRAIDLRRPLCAPPCPASSDFGLKTGTKLCPFRTKLPPQATASPAAKYGGGRCCNSGATPATTDFCPVRESCGQKGQKGQKYRSEI